MSKEDMNFDASPYVKLFIDKEGRWFQNGDEIIHPGIYSLFCNALEDSPGGGYRVRIGRETCMVEVEDTPFVVRAIREAQDGSVNLLLNDGTAEEFDPQTFWISSKGIPYCRIKNDRFDARILRPAYYSLARYVVEDNDSYYFVIKGVRYLVRYQSIIAR